MIEKIESNLINCLNNKIKENKKCIISVFT